MSAAPIIFACFILLHTLATDSGAAQDGGPGPFLFLLAFSIVVSQSLVIFVIPVLILLGIVAGIIAGLIGQRTGHKEPNQN